MKTTLAIVIVCLFATFAQAQALPATPAVPSISTSGVSVVYVSPDQIEINAGVETFDSSLETAKAELDARSQRLLTAIKQAGIEQRQVQTAAVDVSIEYDSNNQNHSAIRGYVARRSYTVKISDVKAIESIVDVILKNGATNLFGITYQTTQLRKYRDEARKMAITAAKEKAQLLAGELGMQVSTPRQINELGSSFGYFGGSGYWGGGYRGMMSQNSVHEEAPSPEIEGTMPLGQIAVRAQVNVTFDMSAK